MTVPRQGGCDWSGEGCDSEHSLALLSCSHTEPEMGPLAQAVKAVGASPRETPDMFSEPFQGQSFGIQRDEMFSVDFVGYVKMICVLGGKLKLRKFTLWGLEDDAAILLHFTACASPPPPLSVLDIKTFLLQDYFFSVN